MVIKCIAQYSKSILNKNKDLRLKIINNLKIDYYINTDFAKFWSYENNQDPVCINSIVVT